MIKLNASLLSDIVTDLMVDTVIDWQNKSLIEKEKDIHSCASSKRPCQIMITSLVG